MVAGGGGGDGSTANSATVLSGPKPSKKSHQREEDHLKPFLSLLTSDAPAAYSQLRDDLHLLPSQNLAHEPHLNSLSSIVSPISAPILPPPPPPPAAPQHCWFGYLPPANCSTDYDPRWTHFFRMSKPSFSLLLGLLSPTLQSTLPSIPPDYTLAAAFFRLAHAVPYEVVAQILGLDSANACRSFYVVCRAIHEKLGDWLELYSDMERILMGFRGISLPNCCGVLGFGKFRVEGSGLRQNGCLLVQALVDFEGRFLDVSAGWPSSLRAGSILRRTPLFAAVEDTRELLNGPNYLLSNGSSIPQYILGDACFPLLPWLLTPYNEKNSFGSLEKNFNSVHSHAMGLVRRAFARVQGRWQLLSQPWKEECSEFLPMVVFAGCLLHNFLMKCNEPVFHADGGVGEWKHESAEDELPVFEGEVDKFGQVVRDALAQHLSWEILRE